MKAVSTARLYLSSPEVGRHRIPRKAPLTNQVLTYCPFLRHSVLKSTIDWTID